MSRCQSIVFSVSESSSNKQSNYSPPCSSCEGRNPVNNIVAAGDTLCCLVLAFETTDFKKKSYRKDEEEITVYTEKTLDTLTREIREEARGKRSLDEQIAKKIWDLGKFEAAG